MTANFNQIISRTIRIEGLVQGVGFRPFVYRMASLNNVKGWVKNTNECVIICAEGNEKNIKTFISKIRLEAPLAAQIETIIELIGYLLGAHCRKYHLFICQLYVAHV